MIELKGKPVAEKIYESLSQQIKNWSTRKWDAPHLAVILVGDDAASSVYVSHKQIACEKLGFKSSLIKLPTTTTARQLSEKINELNAALDVDAILLQLPLPAHLDAYEMTNLIAVHKDADGLTVGAMGELMAGKSIVNSCTPSGIIEILKHYQFSLAGQNALVIGRSQIVGLPLFHLLNKENATVTLAHSKTSDLSQLIQNFEFVFVAIGKKHFFRASEFKKNAVVVDVGIHRTENGLVGDVDSAGAESHLKALTPVPGGVGPMTIAMLMKNTFFLAEKNRKS